MFKISLSSLVVVLGLSLFAAPVFAQNATPQQIEKQTTPATTAAVTENATATTANGTAVADAPAQPVQRVFDKSFLFTPAELSMLIRAGSGKTSGSAILNSGSTRDIPKVRQIRLSGVVFRGAGDWTIWLNGSKLEPGRLLPEIMDIQVQEDRVFLRWFDIGLNDVISITLRPHQVYDIVTGILLPG